MYKEIVEMTDSELKELEQLITAEKNRWDKKEAEEALKEMRALIDKWAEKHISFYICNSYDCRITIYPSEVYVERGWV